MDIFNENKFRSSLRDCENFSNDFNSMVSEAVAKGELLGQPTEEMARGLSMYDATAIKEGVKKAYEVELKKMPATLRLSQERNRDEMLERADALALRIQNHMESHKNPLCLKLNLFERSQMLSFEGGVAKPDEGLIRERYTIKVEESGFIKRVTERAKKLHRELCVLDAQIRKATGGRLGIIGYPDVYAGHVIEVYDGIIDLSLDRLPQWVEAPESVLDEAPELDKKMYIVRDYVGREKPLSEERKEVEK